MRRAGIGAGRHRRDVGRFKNEEAGRGSIRSRRRDVDDHRNRRGENLLDDVARGVHQPAGRAQLNEHGIGVRLARVLDGAVDVLSTDRLAAKTAKAIARKPTPQRTRKSKKKPRRKSVIAKLTPRQGKLLDGIAQLKTPVQAARDAGYSESTARSAYRILQGANVRREFQSLLRRHVDLDKLGYRIAQGLDAVETKLFTYKGVITDSRELINWDARLAYIEIAAKYTGYHVDKQAVEVEYDESSLTDAGQRLDELLKRVAARTEAKGGPAGTG